MKAAPANHKIAFENDRVRVLDVTVAPGERESVHAHCLLSVMYVMAAGPYKDYDATGKLLLDSATQPPATLPITHWMGATGAAFGAQPGHQTGAPAARRVEALTEPAQNHERWSSRLA